MSTSSHNSRGGLPSDATMRARRSIERSIPQAFAEAAAFDPERIALVCGGQRWSYAALAQRAARIAAALQRRRVRSGDLVGLYLQRSPEAIAAILGILQAGAAYVPFDPAYPPKLLRQIFDDCTPALMLTDGSLAADGAAPFWSCRTLDLRGELLPGNEPLPEVMPADPAYVMYTSGSTGRPKGVLVPHRAVLRLVLDNDFAQLGSDEVLLQLAPLAFDASTFEIWGALLNGGTLAILPEPRPALDDIAAAIHRHRVTTLWLTAGLFHLMVDHRIDGLRPLRQLLAGGDVLSLPHVRKALTALPQCRLINGYGPTENTTFSCCYSIPHVPLPDGPIPIGRPILDTEVHILDQALCPVPDGEAGELYVGGAGLALGYLKRPELNAEKFIAHPFSREPGARMYRTGDQVRRRPDGNIEFLGRADRQVKINGKRVELDAVEAALRERPEIADAAAVSCAGAAEQRQIAAFVTLASGVASTAATLRQRLRQQLPDYMVPALLEIVPALPLTPTGKLDRARLPLPSPSAAPEQPSVASVNTMESTLLALWRQILGRDAVSLDDNFFDLGGTSLQLIKLHALLQGALGRDIPLLDLFEYPRIRALAARLSRDAAAQPQTALLSAAERARRRNAVLDRAAHTLRESTP